MITIKKNIAPQQSIRNIPDKSWLTNIPLLSGLNESELETISQGVVFRNFRKGDPIFHMGETADKLHIICGGKIKLYKNLVDGREQLIYILSEGDFFGAFNLLKENEWELNAEALEETFISSLSKGTFDGIILKNPSITLKVFEKAYERIKSIENLVERLSTISADAKVANVLLSLIKDFGIKENNGILLTLSINRQEMGSYAGISRETMTRKLNLFRELGYIEFIGNKKIFIRDEIALKNIS